jgi:proteasome lid subunit RPN8/RPN11
MKFEKFRKQLIDHAEDVFPEECCAVIVDDKYVKLKNVADDPLQFFELSEDDELEYFVDEKKAEAFLHSHPDGPLYPTYPDMVCQIATGVPFVMVGHDPLVGWDYWEFGDHMLDTPLIEREFRHGATDCFAAMRAWWWQKMGLYTSDCPRRDEWWEPNEDGEYDNLYADNLAEWGFVQLTAAELEQGLQVGDAFLYKLHRGNVMMGAKSLETHGGIYVGDGKIYHHLPGRLSSEEQGEGWARKASRWVRYRGKEA